LTLKKYQKNVQRPPHTIWTNPVHFIACGFGIGTFPVCPGTVGTLAAIPLTIMLSHTPLWFYLLACVALFIIGMICCDITNTDFKTSDHPAAVIDEIAAFPLAMILVPITWYYLLIGFCLFRFFDIIKPSFIGWADKNVHGGFGVMLDDLLAAVCTLIILHGLLILL
jgi:phosphatidylglycerophosphatase A